MDRLGRCRLVLVGLVALGAGVDRAGAETPPKVTITDLGGLSGYATTARGINDLGEIVGEQSRSVSETSSESHGLLWRKDGSGRYLPTEIGELPDFPNSYPRSINNSGRIGGWAEVLDLSGGTSPSQVVMWEKDGSGAYVPTDIGTPHGFWYSETAFGGEGGHVLNELGQIAGAGAILPSWQRYACLWAEPVSSPPNWLSPSAGGMSFKAYGVNNAGSVVGDGVQLRKAVLWQKDAAGAYSQVELPTPSGGQRAAAYDINDSGQIVGWVSTSSSRSAIIWERRAGSDDYEPHYLESPPGATLSAANAINNSGDVVGWALIPSPPTAFRHAVLWRAGDSGQLVPMELGALPGGTSSDAYGINESGQIVGSSTSWDETAQKLVGHAVLWELDTDVTPPEIRQVEADPAVLWPPNHKMRDVIVRYEVADDSSRVTCSLGPVACNEPVTPDDWRVVDDSRVQLRSERYGSQQGRTYTIPITCTDESGNTASQAVLVTVPHDQRR